MGGFGVRRALSAAIIAAGVVVSGSAAAQKMPKEPYVPKEPVVVTVPDGPVPISPPAYRPPSRAEVLGIRIEPNGALITGPMNARRTFLPLDKAIVGDAMRGHWARSVAACAPRPMDWENGGERTATDNIMVNDDLIDAKRPMRILQSFIPVPPHISFAMLESGKPMVQRARRHRDAEEILVIFAMPDGKRDYSVMTLSADHRSIIFQNGHSREVAVRCP